MDPFKFHSQPLHVFSSIKKNWLARESCKISTVVGTKRHVRCW